ncbi:aldo/keto reductase family protein [[Mycoplasma] imitans]|uniref:aldo/keto reductase family protein n=1 Tax=[Mycoplasma] imitans TaxID=29560 RepID=UPI0006843CDC|nr:aldo/keto reductase [[Mycoplasma] imitans]
MSDIKKAKIGFGTYKILNQNEMNNAIKWAIKAKYDFIDTAKLYQTEELIAVALKKLKKEDPKFVQPVLQSKIWPSDFKNGVEKELKGSLKRLGIKLIDCYMLHRPHVDNTMNVMAWKELIECKKKGLVKTIGVSNFEPDMIRILYNETGVYPEVVQNEANLQYIRRDRIVYCKEHKIAMQGWRAMGNAKLNFSNKLLSEMAKKYACSVAQLMIAYSASLGFCPVVRSAVESEIKENVKGVKIKLKPEDTLTLEQTFNTHKSTTHNGCDSYANLALNDDWYKEN